MNFVIDLSMIDTENLDSVARLFGEFEIEFADRPELETVFQELQDICRSESILRQMNLQPKGQQTFELLDLVALGPAACMCLNNVFRRWAIDDHPGKRIFGEALAGKFVLY